MNIGIDAKAISRQWTGISYYCIDVLKYISQTDKENNYYLYSNKDFELPFDMPNNFHKRIIKSKRGTSLIRYKLKKHLLIDEINVFWGPDHCIPKKSKHYKTVLTIHDLAILRFKGISTKLNTLYIKFFLKKIAKGADKILTVSNSTKSDIIQFFKIQENKINVIYIRGNSYSIDNTTISKNEVVNQMNKYSIDSKYMLFVGSIEPRKNIVNIIKSFNEYKKKSNSSIKLVLVGGKGWNNDSIYNEIDNSPFKKDIVVTGYVSNLEKEIFYRSAEFLIFPSLFEGFGIPILEAMSVGLPVITTNGSGMKEVGGDVAFYVNNPSSVSEITSTIEEVINLSYEEKCNIKNASVLRANCFTSNNFAKETLNTILNNDEDKK